jgi:hypothetical protein
MQLMGSWNWWFPAWLDRRLPRIDLSERDDEAAGWQSGEAMWQERQSSPVATGLVNQEP